MNEYKDVLRVWTAKAADALKNKILIKQIGAATDTFEIGCKDPSGNMMYCPSDKTPLPVFLTMSVDAWQDGLILYGDGTQSSTFKYAADKVGLGTTGTPFVGVAIAGANFTGKGMHVKNTTSPAYLILESAGFLANGHERGYGAGRIVFGGNNSSPTNEKLMQIIGGGNSIEFQGLDDNGDVSEDDLLTVTRTALYSDLFKAGETEISVNDKWLRVVPSTGRIYAMTPE